jgi:hypothetical protein
VVISAPWPWSLLNIGSALVTVGAIVVAWKSADRVLRKNRAWTRAWRILVCGIAVAVGGVWFPIGAAYILIQYGPQTYRRRATPSSS